MHSDVAGAVAFVERQVARLLSGRVGVWELVMTGGLWRVTGQQLEAAAAAAAAAGKQASKLPSMHACMRKSVHTYADADMAIQAHMAAGIPC